jgi:DNA mismatch repair ATPase MutS
MAEIDALCSLATVSTYHKMTKPAFLSNKHKPSLKIIQMRHPLVEK